MSLANFSSCSQQHNSKQSHLLIPEHTLCAVSSQLVMTHCYDHLRRQRNRHPKCGLAVETNDVIYTPGGFENFITYIIEVSVESRAGLSSKFKMA